MVNAQNNTRQAVWAALGSAALIGASIPAAKLIPGSINPWMLAAVMFFGAGMGLGGWRRVNRRERPMRITALSRNEKLCMVVGTLLGEVAGPVLLMLGLSTMAAAGTALLLNAEVVFTVLIAWIVFREHVSPRIVLGMVAIVAGGIAVTFSGIADVKIGWAPVFILGACLCWAVDSNLTRHVTGPDPDWIAMVKSLTASATCLLIAETLGAAWPTGHNLALTLALGAVFYGIGLTLFVVALRGLGTGRTEAYFATALFVCAALLVAIGEPVTVGLVAGGVLMGVGVWLHLGERHSHQHTHRAEDGGEPTIHTHRHFPDVNHRHSR